MEHPGHITLSELQAAIKRGVEQALPLSQWVVAEVSEIKVNYSGHCYLQLVEKGAQGQPKAQVQAVAWRSSWGSIAPHFRAETGSDPAPGMKLLLRVTVSYHELYGLSLVVGDIDPSYTLGDIEAERQRTIAQLQKDGIFDMNRELPEPTLFQRIAVISSRNAAGYQDFCKELQRSPYRFETTLFDAFMQGEAAESSMIAALDAIAERMDDFDAMVIIRGGGSQSDLACFNSYRLCSHVAQFPLRVITGIGHDKDRSVADMVAAVELKTPTAVAGWLHERMAGEEEFLNAATEVIRRGAGALLEGQNQLLGGYLSTLRHICGTMARTLERRMDELQHAIAFKAAANIARREAGLATLKTLLASRAGAALTAQGNRLTGYALRSEAHDPQRILALGFAVVRAGGKAIKGSGEVTPGERIEITLAKGKLNATIEK